MAGFEFESRHAFLVRVWDSRGFTPSPESTKYAFQGMRFPRIKKIYIYFNIKYIKNSRKTIDLFPA
jgi:hypothetical protein